MPWKCVYVIDNLSFFLSGTRATDTALEGYDQASMAALIGANLKQTRFHNTVEADPIKSLKRQV